MIPFLLKSHVKAHFRMNPSGHVSMVRQYDNARCKKAPEKKEAVPSGHPLVADMDVSFKPEGGKKLRRGVIVEVTGDKVKVQGRRDSKGQQQEFTVDKTAVIPRDKKERQQKDARYTVGDKTMARKQLTAKESLRRKDKGMERLGMTEDEVLKNKRVHGAIILASATLAKKNSIPTLMDGAASKNLWHRAVDPAYADLIHEYALGALESLRRETESLPDADIKEFREHLGGERKISRIFTNMMKHGKKTAIRYLNTRHGKEDLIDIQSDAHETRQKLSSLKKEAHQEKDLQPTVEQGIEKFLRRLPDVDADLIRRKFGLGENDPQTNEQIASELNSLGSKHDGKHKWTRNKVGEAVVEALGKLKKLGGVDELRGFMKSLWERLEASKGAKELNRDDLKKAVAAAPGMFILKKSHVSGYSYFNSKGTFVSVGSHEDTRARKDTMADRVKEKCPDCSAPVMFNAGHVYKFSCGSIINKRTKNYVKRCGLRLVKSASLFLLKSKYSPAQQAKIKKVMEEFRAGTLKSSDGTVVTDRKQALAIALSEARRV